MAIPTSTIDPFSDELLTDPYDAHRALREAAPVVRLERYGVWAVARHADVDAALRDPATFCSSRGVGLIDFEKEPPWRPPSLLLEADPPDHTVARKVITDVLSPRAVRSMRDTFRAEAERLVDELVGRGRFDGVADLAAVFPVKVFPDQLGLSRDGRENLLPYGSMVFNAYGPRNEHLIRSMEGGDAVREWITTQTRREALAPGGLGEQVHDRAEAAGYTPEQAGTLVRSFLSAGVDTTVHGIGNALYCFAEHPDQWRALREDPSRLRAAFEEVMRFESSVQIFFRTTTRATEIDGSPIAAGEKVLLFLAAANRDPRQWDDPDAFEIGRRATGHVAFGAGIHACIGQMMARLEAEVVLEALLARVAELRPAGPPVRKLNNSLRGLASLPLEVVPAASR